MRNTVRKYVYTSWPILLLLLGIGGLASCDDHGLSPADEPAGFGGTITVESPWSPPDSLYDLRVLAFRTYPPDDILGEVAAGDALISDPLEFNLETQQYAISAEDVSGVFEYIVVAQQYGESVYEHWRAVGVYTTSGDPAKPSAITLDGSRYVSNVDISVNFYELPPQPF